MPSRDSIYPAAALCAWTVALLLAGWRVEAIIQGTASEVLLQQSRAIFEQVVLTRAWNARHGGVYVFPSQDTPPNPYLQHPRRDLTLDSGETLTMVNPAYMTRKLAELAAARGMEHSFRITSLRPLRPGNAPDEWERAALETFEAGQAEHWERFAVEADQPNATLFRYMAPLLVEQSCLNCHAQQGYKQGEIRGGISVASAAGNQLAAAMHLRQGVLAWFGGIWLAGGLLLVAGVMQLTRSRRAALEGGRVKAEFMAAMSHELRTPLNGILGLTDLALAGPLSEEQRGYLETSRHSAARLSRLFHFMLEYARLDLGGGKARGALESKPFALGDCLHLLEHDHAARAAAKGLTLQLELAPDLPMELVGDMGALETALAQLLDNAIRFTESGAVTLAARPLPARRGGSRSPARCRLEFTVADTGPGLSPEKLRQVRQPFTQGDGSLARSHQGAGLGLALADKIAQAMDGELLLESQPGQGLVARLRLAFRLPG